jgi:hypothetical protein
MDSAREQSANHAAQNTDFEQVLADWHPSPASGTVALSHRQLAVIGFLGMVALVLMASLSYVAGRVASAGPSHVVMVDSVSPKPAEPPKTAPAAVAVAEPLSGESYWQVGALDKGMANVSARYLQENSLPVRLAPIPGTAQFRVLVGPGSNEALAALKPKLDGLGFPSFLKRY